MTLYARVVDQITVSFTNADGSPFYLDSRVAYKVLPYWAAIQGGFTKLWDQGRVQVSQSTTFSPLLTSTTIPSSENPNGGSGGSISGISDVPGLVTALAAKAASTDLATLVTKGSLFLNVKDYGAVGNGTTDDTTAILAAISAANSAGGGCVFFPGDIYAHTGLAYPSATGFITLLGTAPGGTQLLNTHATNASITVTGPGGGTANRFCQLANLDINASAVRSGQKALDMAWTVKWDSDNVRIRNHGVGINMATIWGGAFRNTHIESCTTAISSAFASGGGASCPAVIENMTIYNCTTGLLASDGLTGVTWHGGTIANCTTGAQLDGFSNTAVSFYGIVFENNVDDVLIGTSSTGGKSILFSNCLFLAHANKARSVYFQRGLNVTFDTCYWDQDQVGQAIALGIQLGSAAGTATFINPRFDNVTTHVTTPTGSYQIPGGTSVFTAVGFGATPGISRLGAGVSTIPQMLPLTSTATPTINTDTCDFVNITGLATAITSMTSGLTGTPFDGQVLRIRIKDNGTARAITWGTKFTNSPTYSLPTTTVANATMELTFVWQDAAALWVIRAGGDVPTPTLALQAANKSYVDAVAVEVVTYSGSLSTARPTAPAVYWVGFPSTPTNAQSQDIVTGSSPVIPADYFVTVSGATYTATPRNPSNTTYSGTNFTTVMQSAITALTPAGAAGSSGGKIHVSTGTFTFGNEVTITGWEGITGAGAIPTSSLIIEAEGLATKFVQNTSGQNAFVVKNCANVSFLDMYASIGASAKSFILGDSNGAQSEMSFWGGILRVNVISSSTTAAPIYIKNFFDLDMSKIWSFSNSFDSVVLENASTTINYGNSHIGFMRSVATGNKGLVMRTTDSTANTFKTLGMIDCDNFQCVSSGTGLYTQGVQAATFGFVDIENCTTCVFFDATDLTHKNSRNVTILDGYLQPSSTGTAIKGSVGAGGNSVRARVQQSASEVLINDPMQFLIRNQYDLRVGSAAIAATRSITTPGLQKVTIAADDLSVIDTSIVPSTTSTATAAGTSTLTVNTAPVQIFTGTTTQIATLPTTGVWVGFSQTINNQSTARVTVNASGGVTVAIMDPKSTLVLQANVATPTTPVGWSVVGGTCFVAGQVDPNSLWSAASAEPCSRVGLVGIGLTTQIALFSYFTAPVANTITKLGFATTSTGASSGITLARVGLYTVAANGDLTMVARTANTTTLGNANSTLNQAALDATGGFVTSYTYVPGQRYAHALLQVGTTPSGIFGFASDVPVLGQAPQLCARVTGASDLLTTYTAATVPAWFSGPWVVGLP